MVGFFLEALFTDLGLNQLIICFGTELYVYGLIRWHRASKTSTIQSDLCGAVDWPGHRGDPKSGQRINHLYLYLVLSYLGGEVVNSVHRDF